MPHVSLPTTSSVGCVKSCSAISRVPFSSLPTICMGPICPRTASSQGSRSLCEGRRTVGGTCRTVEGDHEHVFPDRYTCRVIVGHRDQRQQLRRFALVA